MSTYLSALSMRPVNRSASLNRTMQRLTSVEDLAEQGYCIGRVLGEGTYCKVKKATYNGKTIAVKIITRSQLSLEFESKFLPREIEILRRARHRNIVHVYTIFSYPKRVYIFMELIEKGDLLKLIRNRGRLAEAEARRYFRQLVSGMRYLHSLNYAHRDLKCENIMINDADEIKIVDFGFSRSTVNKAGRRELCSTFCGSTAYAAPEILQGIPYNAMLSDVWSMGCVLFIMVTGTKPFNDSNTRKMINCQLRKEIQYPETFSINNEIKGVISRMLEPDVTKRAILNHIIQIPWVREHKKDHGVRISSDVEINTTTSCSTGTQTDN